MLRKWWILSLEGDVPSWDNRKGSYMNSGPFMCCLGEGQHAVWWAENCPHWIFQFLPSCQCWTSTRLQWGGSLCWWMFLKLVLILVMFWSNCIFYDEAFCTEESKISPSWRFLSIVTDYILNFCYHKWFAFTWAFFSHELTPWKALTYQYS